MMNRKFLLVCSLFLTLQWAAAQPMQELRGVWLAWAGANVPSKERIATIMEKIAAANFNTVYVDVWRYGYPYYRSELFHSLTSKYTDPALEAGRDVLADMIAEGHRHGLHVEAWFEHGFVAGQGPNDDLYDVHPEWFAQNRAGSVLFNGSLQFKWLSHVNGDAQQFLIDMVQEVIENYDVDGVELDRIRYPELNCGYDSATVAVYRAEHNGNDPPQDFTNYNWRVWRGQKLVEFMAACYDSFKAVNPNLPVSNAPIVYPFGFDNFCQDWRPWINEGHLDFVTPQVYRLTNSIYNFELNLQLGHVNDHSKFYPGITTVANEQQVETGELIKMIETTRDRNLPGHVIWFVDTVEDDLDSLKNTVYAQPAEHTLLPPDWRRPALIIDERDNTYVQRSNGWNLFTTVPGYGDSSLYATSGSSQWIEYSFDIDQSGWYEVYAFIMAHWNGMPAAPYELYGVTGTEIVQVDQRKEGHRRWYKLGDVYLHAGNMQKVVRLSNAGVGSNIVFADAMMLLNSNRTGLPAVGIPDDSDVNLPQGTQLLQNYPNPFNPGTTIEYRLQKAAEVQLVVYNLLGQKVKTLVNKPHSAGAFSANWDGKDERGNTVVSGIYLYRLQVAPEGRRSAANVQTRKMILLR